MDLWIQMFVIKYFDYLAQMLVFINIFTFVANVTNSFGVSCNKSEKKENKFKPSTEAEGEVWYP